MSKLNVPAWQGERDHAEETRIFLFRPGEQRWKEFFKSSGQFADSMLWAASDAKLISTLGQFYAFPPSFVLVFLIISFHFSLAFVSFFFSGEFNFWILKNEGKFDFAGTWYKWKFRRIRCKHSRYYFLDYAVFKRCVWRDAGSSRNYFESRRFQSPFVGTSSSPRATRIIGSILLRIVLREI